MQLAGRTNMQRGLASRGRVTVVTMSLEWVHEQWSGHRIPPRQTMALAEMSALAIVLRRRIRPLRVGFLLEPRLEEVTRAVELCTALWGGLFNVLIPASPESSSQRDEMLQRFEPDYLVTSNESLLPPAARARRQYTTFDELLQSFTKPGSFSACGLNVNRHFYDLYVRELRFQRREASRDLVLSTFNDPRLATASAVLWGRFPSIRGCEYFEEAFVSKLGAVRETVDEASYWQRIDSEQSSPLRLGIELLRVGGYATLTLLLMDFTSADDLIDLWNLRAAGWRTIAVPLWGGEESANTCRNLLLKYMHEVGTEHPQLVIGGRVLRTRNVPDETWRMFASAFPPSSRIVVTHAPFDRTSVEMTGRPHAVIAEELDDDLTAHNDRWFSFRDAAPVFVARDDANDDGIVRPHWTTDAQILLLSERPDITTVFPEDADDVRWLMNDPEPVVIRPREKWLSFTTSKRGHHRFWRVPTALEVFSDWAERHRLTIEISEAGRIAMEIVRSMGSFRELSYLANVELLTKLHNLTHERRVRVGWISPEELDALIKRLQNQISSADPLAPRAQVSLEKLVERNVLRLGLQIRCTHCGQHGWYALDRVGYVQECDRCLQTVAFPSTTPGDAKWRYRPIGPFAIESFAHGSYGVLLALRFFYSPGADWAWIPSFILKGDDLDLEVDAAALVRDSMADHTTMLMIEAKSGQARFGQGDYDKASKLMSRFPGLAFAFASMNERLDGDETAALAQLAATGRVLDDGQWRNPVIVLTQRELESASTPSSCWREVLGDDAIFRQHEVADLTWIAAASQQVHLGLAAGTLPRRPRE
jgi:hypothetical protein